MTDEEQVIELGPNMKLKTTVAVIGSVIASVFLGTSWIDWKLSGLAKATDVEANTKKLGELEQRLIRVEVLLSSAGSSQGGSGPVGSQAITSGNTTVYTGARPEQLAELRAKPRLTVREIQYITGFTVDQVYNRLVERHGVMYYVSQSGDEFQATKQGRAWLIDNPFMD